MNQFILQKQAMENAWYATHSCGPTQSSTYAMNAITDHSKDAASCVEELAWTMRTIVESVHRWKRIGRAVRRLWIWGVRRRICFMNGRSMGLRNGDLTWREVKWSEVTLEIIRRGLEICCSLFVWFLIWFIRRLKVRIRLHVVMLGESGTSHVHVVYCNL